MVRDGSEAVVAGIVGKRVQALFRERFLFDGEPQEEDAGALELLFEDGTRVTLHTANDGQSVLASEGKLALPVSFVMTEWKGQPRYEWEQVALTEQPGWAHLAESDLIAVEAMASVWAGRGAEVRTGWRLHFSTGDFLLYLNAGDDAKLYLNALPPLWPNVATVWRAVAGEK